MTVPPSNSHSRLLLPGLAAACLGLLPASACSLVTTVGGPPEGFVPLGERPRTRGGLLDLRGVIHCHSYLSHDSEGTVQEIAAACASVGHDFLVMTDHQTPVSVTAGQRGFVGSTLFIVGAEIRVPGGSLLAFPLQKSLQTYPSLKAYLEEVHAQGGLALVDHAESFTAWQEAGLDGIEIVNLHAATKSASKPGLILRFLFQPMGCLLSALTARPSANLATWDRCLESRHPFTPVGGGDAHANIQLLGPFGGTVGSYEEIFSTLSTHVLAKDLDEAAIVEAIRLGRTYVVYDLWRDGTGFQFWAQKGNEIYSMGETVRQQAGLGLQVLSPAAAEIRLLCNGRLQHSRRGKELLLRDPLPGVYRVEVLLDGDRPWIYSSSIRVQ